MYKLVCIRTVFFHSPYDKKSTKWSRNKIYHFKPIDASLEALKLIGYIETDMIIEKAHHGLKTGEKYYSPISEKECKKCFTTIEDFRDRKITHILNNKNDNENDFI
jgi:hypothetical protein